MSTEKCHPCPHAENGMGCILCEDGDPARDHNPIVGVYRRTDREERLLTAAVAVAQTGYGNTVGPGYDRRRDAYERLRDVLDEDYGAYRPEPQKRDAQGRFGDATVRGEAESAG